MEVVIWVYIKVYRGLYYNFGGGEGGVRVGWGKNE